MDRIGAHSSHSGIRIGHVRSDRRVLSRQALSTHARTDPACIFRVLVGRFDHFKPIGGGIDSQGKFNTRVVLSEA